MASWRRSLPTLRSGTRISSTLHGIMPRRFTMSLWVAHRTFGIAARLLTARAWAAIGTGSPRTCGPGSKKTSSCGKSSTAASPELGRPVSSRRFAAPPVRPPRRRSRLCNSTGDGDDEFQQLPSHRTRNEGSCPRSHGGRASAAFSLRVFRRYLDGVQRHPSRARAGRVPT